MSYQPANNEFILNFIAKNPERNIYAISQLSPELDAEMTRLLSIAIKETAEYFAKLPEKQRPEVHPFSQRNKLMHGYIADKKTPEATKIIFTQAASIEKDLHSRQPLAINSMDLHYGAGILSENGTIKVDLSSQRISRVPSIMAYATLLMNPLDPTDPNDLIRPLQEGRMEEHAKILANTSGDSVEDHLKANFTNVCNIAAWRFTQPLKKGQAPFEHFIKCAALSNEIGGYGLDKEIFNQAIYEHLALSNE